jgi:hypothetical protein
MMRSTNIVSWTVVPIDPVLLVPKAMDESKNLESSTSLQSSFWDQDEGPDGGDDTNNDPSLD